MSTYKNQKIDIYKFETVWARVKKNTDISTQVELAETVGVKQGAVSARKTQDIWPEEWAYRIAKKYNFLTEWILTGKGQKRLEIEGNEPLILKNRILQQADEWLTEVLDDEPWREVWFRGSFEDAFPAYKTWLTKKAEQEQDNQNQFDQKAA